MSQIAADIQVEVIERGNPAPLGILLNAKASIVRTRTPRPYPEWLLLGLLLLFIASPTHATSIAFEWLPAELILVADSKVSDDSCQPIASVCKIEKIGNLFAAYAGPTIFRNLGTGEVVFDGREVVRSILRQRKSLRDARDSFETEMSKELTGLTSHLRAAFAIPPLDTQRWLNGNLSVSIVLVGTEDSAVSIYQTKIDPRLEQDGSVSFFVLSNPRDRFECPSATCWRLRRGAIGRTDAILNRGIAEPTFQKLPPMTAARLWVQTEIDSHVDGCWVGGPIDILRVSKDGACWVQRKDSCQQDIPICQDTTKTTAPTAQPLPEPPLVPGPPR